MLPYITEKTIRLAQKGMYTLIAPVDSEKISVANKIEKIYQVTVTSARILKKSVHARRRGKMIGYIPGMKKVIITLKKGQKIPGFETATENEKKHHGHKTP